MTRLGWTALGATALLPFAASAFPTGAPWSTLDRPDSACTSCHFGAPPVAESEALSIEGLEEGVQAGETYALTLRFDPADAAIMAYLARFRSEGEDAGSVAAGEGQQVRETSVRSTEPQPAAVGGASWTFDWTAPATPGLVALHIAANAANDDSSPLGDTIHVRTFEIEVAEQASE